MTDDVAALVLRDNYLQGEALSVAEARGRMRSGARPPGAADPRSRTPGRLDRALEFLPDDETLAARAAARRGLTRPELAVLLAYAKMSLDHDLLRLRPARPARVGRRSARYFPPALRERFRGADRGASPAARDHRDGGRPTIWSTAPASPSSTTCRRAPGAAPDIARAYRIVREVFALPRAVGRDRGARQPVAPAALQNEMLLDIAGVVEHEVAWLLRRARLDLGPEIARFGPPLRQLGEVVDGAAAAGRAQPPRRPHHAARRARRAANAGERGPAAWSF